MNTLSLFGHRTKTANEYKDHFQNQIGTFKISQVHRKAISFLPANAKRILDIGCGYGELLFLLEQINGLDTFGIDYIEDYVKESRKRLSKTIVDIGNCTKLPYPNNFFDVVYALGVLGYLAPEDIDITLKEISRVLIKDGIFVIRTSTLINKVGNIILSLLKREYKSIANHYPTSFYKDIWSKNNFNIIHFERSVDRDNNRKTLLDFIFSSLWVTSKNIKKE